MIFHSPVHIHRLLVTLLMMRAPIPSATSCNAAVPTPRRRASFAACDGFGVRGKAANALKDWPMTYVMKGAMPPAAKDDAMAGVSNTSFRLGVRNEKSSLNVGAGGDGRGMSWTDADGEERVGSESCFLLSIEESVDVRTDSSSSGLEFVDGSWLFIAVADDDEQRLTLLWMKRGEEKC